MVLANDAELRERVEAAIQAQKHDRQAQPHVRTTTRPADRDRRDGPPAAAGDRLGEIIRRLNGKVSGLFGTAPVVDALLPDDGTKQPREHLEEVDGQLIQKRREQWGV
jgi:hypothetical protein